MAHHIRRERMVGKGPVGIPGVHLIMTLRKPWTRPLLLNCVNDMRLFRPAPGLAPMTGCRSTDDAGIGGISHFVAGVIDLGLVQEVNPVVKSTPSALDQRGTSTVVPVAGIPSVLMDPSWIVQASVGPFGGDTNEVIA
ncbi:hypothetical protein GBA52_010363 [Prunus armeniaca]|nr:hypothetical protein GBA52_010363 [Prunus armeniaca]